jgi:DNA repair photolyase
MNTETLFPILQPSATGIARMAAEGEHADEGHEVEFKMLKVRSVLNRTVSKRRLSMAYSINPYRGCEFGCRYCYARYTHEFLAPKERVAAAASGIDFHDPEMFERLIFIKENAAWLLEQELRRIDPRDEIALGTATDPYQPIERRARVTRALLEVFARRQGYRLGIVTKSRLIERDTDLLAEIARRNTLVVHVTITTADVELARKLEPRAPRPDLRFRAVQRLREAGIITGVLCCPLLPGITDTEEAIDGMARRAAEAGASFFAANPLFLKPCSRPTYLQFVEEHFPALMPEYQKRFGAADFAAEPYRREMALLVDAACRRHQLRPRSSDALLTRNPGPHLPLSAVAQAQQRLFD